MEEIKEKICFKCKQLLPLDDYYLHKKMKDGHLNKCKECTKKSSIIRESELRKNPFWVESEKKRAREKYYRLGYSEKHPNSDNKRIAMRKYNQKYPEKYLAKKYLEIYLTRDHNMNLHHWSYNQEDWLDIIEMSIKDHHFLHRYIIYDQEQMMYRDLHGVLLDSKEKHLEYYEKCKNKYEY